MYLSVIINTLHLIYLWILEKKGDEALTLTDLLKNNEFLKQIFTMKEFTDASLKKYLNLNVGQLAKEIIEETDKNKNKNNNVDTSNNNGNMIYMKINGLLQSYII